MNASTARSPGAAAPARDVRIAPGSPLRRALGAQAVACGAIGLASVAGAAPIAHATRLPEPLLLVSGALLLVWSACLGWLRRQPRVPRVALRMTIGLDLLWAIDATLLLATGAVAPAAAGAALVAGHAALAAGFALALHRALRRADAAAAAFVR